MAKLIWERIGDVDNFIEPFAGSAAVLLARPHAPRIETINDADCMVANFWRSTAADPDSVARFADGPVNEADLHARHRWLVLSSEAKDFRRRMRTDPTYYDVRFAGWWCWGLCCWIGGGWCSGEKVGMDSMIKRGKGQLYGPGVNAKGPALSPNRKPRIDGGEGQHGHGVHAKGLKQQVPILEGHYGSSGRGVHAPAGNEEPTAKRGEQPHEWNQIPAGEKTLTGVNGKGPSDANRPQLADAFSRGRGVNGNDSAGTCEQRRLWLCDWFGQLRDRLRTVRVCCGDWLRVCDSESVTTRLGTTGIFFDPPYSTEAGRDMNLYAVDCGNVAHAVRAYCLERGSNPQYRIALAGYAGEGHEELESAGWDVVEWATSGGYGNRSEKGKANAKKERLWFSPNCSRPGATLFD